MKYTDVMIDIETLGKGANAAIIQIGACAFNIRTGELGARFQTLVKPTITKRGHAFGADVDLSTIMWWLGQSDEARASVVGAYEHGREESDAIGALAAYMIDNGDLSMSVWAMPPEFDLTIIASTAQRCGVSPPWHYASTRDLRTLEYLVGGNKSQRVVPKIPHDAGWDAEAQAQTAIAYYQRMKVEI